MRCCVVALVSFLLGLLALVVHSRGMGGCNIIQDMQSGERCCEMCRSCEGYITGALSRCSREVLKRNFRELMQDIDQRLIDEHMYGRDADRNTRHIRCRTKTYEAIYQCCIEEDNCRCLGKPPCID